MATANFVSTKNFPIVAIYDEQYEENFFDYEDFADSVVDFFEPLHLMFFRPKPVSGYYEGAQILFEEIDNPNEMTNDETQHEFGLCRSKAIRAYQSEINKINRKIDELVNGGIWMKFAVLERFSNGECIYQQM